MFYEGLRLWGGSGSNEAKALGGSAKEKSSRVWGGSGVGAELRSELQSVECLEDFGSGCQIVRNF